MGGGVTSLVDEALIPPQGGDFLGLQALVVDGLGLDVEVTDGSDQKAVIKALIDGMTLKYHTSRIMSGDQQTGT